MIDCFVFEFDNGDQETKQNPIYSWQESDKYTGVVCDWYGLRHSKQENYGLLIEQEMFFHGSHSCDFYVCSLPPPIFSVVNGKNNVALSTETVNAMQEFIKQ